MTMPLWLYKWVEGVSRQQGAITRDGKTLLGPVEVPTMNADELKRLTDEEFSLAVEVYHAKLYPNGCPLRCEACVKRLGVETGRQFKAAEDQILREIGDIFGLEMFTITATMLDGTVKIETLYAETWKAAGRCAEQRFVGAKTIIIMGGKS